MLKIKRQLDILVELYKNGISMWSNDETFLQDCAYYEGKIKKASELLDVDIPFTYLKEITPDIQEYFDYGYNLID
jgi:hypothetical protein